MIKMNKKFFKLSRVEKKLKLENLTRCLNCALFCQCELRKEEMIVCDKFKEISAKKQLVVVSLEEWAELKARKDMSLCKFC